MLVASGTSIIGYPSRCSMPRNAGVVKAPATTRSGRSASTSSAWPWLTGTRRAAAAISEPAGSRDSHVTDAIRPGGSSASTSWSVHWLRLITRTGRAVTAGAGRAGAPQPPSSNSTASARQAGRPPIRTAP